jgi:hypothetical protein
VSFSVSNTLTPAGRVNTPPATLNAALIAGATALSPGLSADLPGALIEDIASTDTGAAVIIDQLVTELEDSFSPFAANPYILTELGQIYIGQGSTSASASNTAAFVVFTGTVGFVISPGFVVGDGTNQYAVADGGIIQTGGTSGNVFVQALNVGSFPVPANTITTLVTSVPSSVTLSVNNPQPGTPGAPAQTEGQYRAQVLTAGLVAGTGTPNFLKTLLAAVPGVQMQLISVRPQTAGWEIIVGGTGDALAIALAIFQSGIDTNTLVGSTINSARNVTISINSFPDSYPVIFVAPPIQAVLIAVTWNTSSVSFVSSIAVAGLVQGPIAAYVNSLPVGAPINLLELNDTFINAVTSILPENLITVLVWTVTINGSVVPPGTGTVTVAGDPESSFSMAASSVTVIQG